MYPEILIPLNEQERVYEFPPLTIGLETTIVKIEQPRELALQHPNAKLHEQTHMIKDESGAIHYVAPGWKHIAVILNKPTPLTNIIAENVIESGAGSNSQGNNQ